MLNFSLFCYIVHGGFFLLGYPHEPPLLGVRNPRGLEDSAVAGLLANMNSR